MGTSRLFIIRKWRSFQDTRAIPVAEPSPGDATRIGTLKPIGAGIADFAALVGVEGGQGVVVSVSELAGDEVGA